MQSPENQTIFYLVDRNQPLYTYSSPIISNVLHEILVKVDTVLQFMMDSGMKQTTLDSLNFNNLECICAAVSCSKPNPIVHDIFKFNIMEFMFVSTFSGDKMGMVQVHSLLCSQIKEKINYLTNTTNTTKQVISNKPKLVMTNKTEPINPIKKLFEETRKIVNDVTTAPVQHTRTIPTVDSDEDEDEVVEQNNRIGPDVPRPMDSILLKEDSFENLDPEELKRTIDALENIKALEEQKIKELEMMNESDLENFSRFCNNLGDVKREFTKNKEREEERRNRFEANKSAYRKMKQHILEGKLSEENISPMFKNDYPIYKYMDEKDMLDKEDDYVNYLNMYDELYPTKETIQQKNEYIPHNIHYLSDEEQKKYLEIKNNNKNVIEDFMQKQCQPEKTKEKKYPSLNEILDTIDDGDEVFNEVTFDNDTKSRLNTITTALKQSLSED